MTIEKIIPYKGKFSGNEFTTRILTEAEKTDTKTDTYISIVSQDMNGNVVMLIEASRENFLEERGCFIKRIEYVEEFIDTIVWANAIKAFYNNVKYALCKNNGSFEEKYRYIWMQLPRGQFSIFANSIGAKLYKLENVCDNYVRII